MQRLHQHNLLDILSFVSYRDLIQIFRVNKSFSGIFQESFMIWKILYFHWIYQRLVDLLEKTAHPDAIDYYLSTYYSQNSVHEMIFSRYMHRLEMKKEKNELWKGRFLELLRVQGRAGSQPFTCKFLEPIPIHSTASFSNRKRCGHASGIVRLPATGHYTLIQCCGATTNYHMLDDTQMIDLDDQNIIFQTRFSSIPSQWLSSGVVIENNFFFFDSDLIQLIQYEKLSWQRPDMWILSPSSMTYSDHLYGYKGHSLVVDPLPCNGRQCYRIFLFGGINRRHVITNRLFIITIDLEVNHDRKIQVSEMTQVGEIPSPRYCHACQLIDRQMFVFGGWSTTGYTPIHMNPQEMLIARQSVFFNDLYCLHIDHGSWTKIETFGIPPSPRCQCSMLYFPKKEKRETDENISNSTPLIISDYYLVIISGACHDIRLLNQENVTYGSYILDLGDIYCLDLETMLWLPCHFFDDRIRGGCLGAAYYPGDWKGLGSGWILSGGIQSDPGSDMPNFRNDIIFFPNL